jgi:hypothetical protein
VSCCQDPQYAPADLSSIFRAPDRWGQQQPWPCCGPPGEGAFACKVLLVLRRPETGHWASTFEYCRNKCRTSSKSTVHENAYLSTFHHCFSAAGATFPL